jgi:peptide/nickel transport system permease protein
MHYLLRRGAHALLVLTGISILVFLLLHLAPGEFLAEMRLNPQISAETIAALRAQYGLDQPLPAQYLRWLQSVVRGDFGFSFAYNVSVTSLLRPRVLNTLALTATATFLAWIFAVPLGIWCAARRGSWGDRLCAAGTSTLLAVPDIVLALALLALALRSGFFPAGGMASLEFASLDAWGKTRDLAAHMALPCLALTLGILPLLVRHVRAGMVEALNAPFIGAARAHGISPRRLLWRHALPAAANPLISLFGMSIGGLLSASLLIEAIMGWPGLGPLLLEAILARDFYVVLGAVMYSAVFMITGNLCSDLLLYAVDPRIRRE